MRRVFGLDSLLPTLFAISFLITVFFKLDWWRDRLLDQTAFVSWSALVGLQLVIYAVAWRYLLCRGFVWAAPSTLTWQDFTGDNRTRAVSGRLWAVWSTLVVVLAYLTAFVSALHRAPPEVWYAGGALLGTSALVSLALARKEVLSRWAGTGWPVGLATLGVLVTTLDIPVTALYPVAALMGIAAVLAWRGTGPLLRPTVASAGRGLLVETWAGRVTRSMALSFIDPIMMMPSATSVGGRPLRRTVLPRLAWLGVRGRARYVGASVLVAVAVTSIRVAMPGLPEVALVAAGGYLALIPFAGGLGELWNSAGRRRWVGSSDLAVRAAHAAVLTGFTTAWGVLLASIFLLFGVSLSSLSWWALALVPASAIRTVTRPPISYDVVGVVDTPFGMVPTGLVKQTARGPDCGMIGACLLILMPLGPWTLVLVAATVVWGLLR